MLAGALEDQVGPGFADPLQDHPVQRLAPLGLDLSADAGLLQRHGKLLQPGDPFVQVKVAGTLQRVTVEEQPAVQRRVEVAQQQLDAGTAAFGDPLGTGKGRLFVAARVDDHQQVMQVHGNAPGIGRECHCRPGAATGA